ncbi:MAG: cell wall metabolism sensor histidine kinase WalK [Lachnospiraceae bacterium]|nr:cell wall metabolism sensor histidine kinase WalK [Lachnospiraceae bacterium]MCI8779288.1 cell wall metabolism sensor histidine kinase WalK [Lachnospiraceae bacterium]
MKEKWKNLWYRLRTLRVQVFCVMFLVGIIPLVLISNILLKAYNAQIISQKTEELQSYGNVISNLVLSSGYLSGRESSEVEHEAEEVANVYQGRVMIVDQNLNIIKDTYGLEQGKIAISTEIVQCFNGSNAKYVNEIGDYIQLTIPVIEPSGERTIGVILISFSTKNIHLVEESVNYRAILLLIAFAVCILVFSLLYSSLLSKPLLKVTESIDEITRGDTDVSLELSTYSELITVSDSFNKMTGYIREQDTARQEFVSNVSHELKTPLASMKVLSDSLLSQTGMPEELYREFLVDITNEIERMTKIINDLLSMVKMDKNNAKMNIRNVSINELLEQLLKRLRPIAAKRNIELIYESYRPVAADVDEVKISIALNNLIENAIKYNYDDGWVRVTLNADHKFFYVKIEDSGVGIPEELQDKVFERFYRVDKARSRETGGTGLGLALTRNSILLHRGSVKLYSKEKEGTTFTVRIPLNYVASDTSLSLGEKKGVFP